MCGQRSSRAKGAPSLQKTQTGCAPALQGDTVRDLQARCLSTGGRWHPSVAREGFCEYQSPGML